MSIRVFNKPAVVIGGGASATLSSISISSNGTYSASDFGVDGFDVVDVDVQGGGSSNDGEFALLTNYAKSDYVLPNYIGVDYNLRKSAFYGFNVKKIDLNNLEYMPVGCLHYCGAEEIVGNKVKIANYDCMFGTSNAKSINFPNLEVAFGRMFFFPASHVVETFNMPKLAFMFSSRAGGFCQSATFINGVSLPNLIYLSENDFISCGGSFFYAPKLVHIGNSAFAYTQGGGFPQMTFGSVCEIGKSAFYYNINAKEFSFPYALIDGGATFYNCNKLESLNLEGCELITGGYSSNTFGSCSMLSDFRMVVNNGTSGQFNSCYALPSIKFVGLSIYSNNFRYCSKLERLEIYCSSVISLANQNAFQGTPMSSSNLTGNWGSIYVPSSLVQAFKTSTNWAAYSDRITALETDEYYGKYCFPLEFRIYSTSSSFTSIPSEKTNCEIVFAGAFLSCSYLSQINLQNCKAIHSSAFYGCSRVTSISLPNVIYLGQYALYSTKFCSTNTSVGTIEFPKLKYIGTAAFANDNQNGIFDLSLPECVETGANWISSVAKSITNIYAPKLLYCGRIHSAKNLQNVYFPSVVYFGGITGEYSRTNGKLSVLDVPNARYVGELTGLPNLAFISFSNAYILSVICNCNSASYIYLPNVFNVGIAISSCSNVESISIPKLVYFEQVWGGIYSLPKLKKLFLPKLESFGSFAFKDNCSMSKILFKNVLSIKNYSSKQTSDGMFRRCSCLESIYMFSPIVVGLNHGNRLLDNDFVGTPFVNSALLTPNRYGSIFVPADLLSNYQNDSQWSYMSDRFVGLTEQEMQDIIDHFND